MAQPGQNPRDSIYDPFTYMMFGQQTPPTAPPQAFYQNGAPQASGMQPPARPQTSFMKPFTDQNGHIDVGKMMSGANQLVTVLNQAAPAIKQLSPLLKFFKRP
ncbi:hypothetical protein E4665_12835 [Sporolactobacillus shoreae]|uniref:Spore coat protein n=1 Tax=Sporolactobacillus shoreae TaxID=1465501 RepID=A0A4Z0GLP7_9BACL|nr:YppG family protein [Sporolactobacillus shoreae]TGA97105.1 hypothetical protein E4665_12835 [Sporolactobacillus shoreae]